MMQGSQPKGVLDYDYPLNKTDLIEVFSWCVGPVSLRQIRLGEIIKGKWEVNFQEATITFESGSFPIQYIGSFSLKDKSWYWGWKNINKFPDNILVLAEEMKTIGEAIGLKSLSSPTLFFEDNWPNEILVVIACALSKDNCAFYRCPYSNGFSYVSLQGIDDKVFEPITEGFIFISTVTKLIMCYEMNHKIFIEGFLLQNGTKYEWKDKEIGNTAAIIAHFPKEDIIISFDIKDGKYFITECKNYKGED